MQSDRIPASHEGGEWLARANDITPPSPYHVFKLKSEKLAPEQFEPSAVQALDSSSHLLVANEKGGRRAFVVFDRKSETELANPRTLLTADDTTFATLGSVKSLYTTGTNQETVDASADGGAVEASTQARAVVFAATDSGTILSFVVDLSGEPIARNLQTYAGSESPCVAFQEADCKVDCKIEGIASRDAHEMLLGVR